MNAPLLQLTNVTRRFPSGDRDVIVLRSINLSIDAGEFVAIVGASGSGKSTLMNILGCLDHPSKGSYRVNGRETSDLGHDELAYLRQRRFGFIFQRYQLLTYLDAWANVQMPAVYTGTGQGPRQARALELLGQLGLGERAQHRPGQLSGGQQQRVSIARALMNGGDVILADEPTGALDAASGQQVMEILRDLNARGHTVIVITHDPSVAAHARRVIELRDGELVADSRQSAVSRGGTSAENASAMASHRQAEPAACAEPSLGDFDQPRLGSFIEALRMAWQSMASRRLRTILTTLGITIGIASVVSIAWIGEAARRDTLQSFGSIGTNVIRVYSGRDWGDPQASEIRTLVPADAAALAKEVFVDDATPETYQSVTVRYRGVDATANASGVGANYARMYGVRLVEGAWFGQAAVQRRAQVAVIDEMSLRKLFTATGTALGKIILVDNVPCVVIGVVATNVGMQLDRRQLNVWLPYTTGSDRLFGRQHVELIAVRGHERFPGKLVEDGVERLLLQRHRTKDFMTINMDEVAKTRLKANAVLTRMLLTVSVISLIVGGIGVMNIMLVSIAERTQEIGIRMAVGARQRDILMQFLCEAVMVCLLGAMLGIGLALLVGLILPLLGQQTRMAFTIEPVVVATLCSTLVGIVFGYLPARNAARLNPVDALARE